MFQILSFLQQHRKYLKKKIHHATIVPTFYKLQLYGKLMHCDIGIRQEYTNFSKLYMPPQYSRCETGNIKQFHTEEPQILGAMVQI